MSNRTRKNSYNYEELIACGKGQLFTPNSARLPLPGMLMFDRIPLISLSGGAYNKGEVVAELDINESLWFFDCHFRGDPVMPGCLGLDALWQLLGFFLTWGGSEGKGRALGVGELKFTGEVLPTAKKVSYHLDIRRVARKDATALGLADGQVLVDGGVIYEGKNLKTGIFPR